MLVIVKCLWLVRDREEYKGSESKVEEEEGDDGKTVGRRMDLSIASFEAILWFVDGKRYVRLHPLLLG